MLNLKDKLFSDFIALLNPESISTLIAEMKKYQLEHKLKESEVYITKNGFFLIMKRIFPQYTSFNDIFALIFNRFQRRKCGVNLLNGNLIRDLNTYDEISIYDVSISLLFFAKCDFCTKIKSLFDITDMDDDGYVNKREIAKMIYRTNALFCQEENEFFCESTIMHQSLAFIKANRSLNLLMFHPGNLAEVIVKEKFVNYEQFYSALTKINNYKFCVFPCFVNIKRSLLTKKDEKEIYVNSQICDDYIDISNEMISAFNFTKNANAISNKRKICNENNKTPQCTTKDFYKKINIRRVKPHTNCTSSTNKNDTTNANPQNHIKQIDYTNISRIEVLPVKIKQKKGTLPKIKTKPKRSASCMSKTAVLRTYGEIVNDINNVLARTNGDDFGISKLYEINKQIKTKAKKMKSKVKSNSTFNVDFKCDFFKESKNNKINL